MYVLAVGQIGLLVDVGAGFERGCLICFLGVAQASLLLLASVADYIISAPLTETCFSAQICPLIMVQVCRCARRAVGLAEYFHALRASSLSQRQMRKFVLDFRPFRSHSTVQRLPQSRRLLWAGCVDLARTRPRLVRNPHLRTGSPGVAESCRKGEIQIRTKRTHLRAPCM